MTRFTVAARPPVRERESDHPHGDRRIHTHAPVGIRPASVGVGRIAVRTDDERVLQTVYGANTDAFRNEYAAVAPKVSAARIVAPGFRLDEIL